MNLAEILERNTLRIPQNSAVISEDVHWSWKEFNTLVNRMGNALQGLGVRKGDRVGIYLPNSPEYLVVYFAIAKIGAIAVAFNIMYKGAEITYIINNSEATALVCLDGEPLRNVVGVVGELPTLKHLIVVPARAASGSNSTAVFSAAFPVLSYDKLLGAGEPVLAAVDCAADDVVTILYTSGTTGQPKGAMLTHRNFSDNAKLNAFYTLHINDQDRFLTGTPFCHIFFVLTVLGPIYKGAAVITMPRFFPDKALELISRFRVTHFAGVPTMYIYMLQTYAAHPELYDLQSWRFAQAAGAAMPAEYIERIEQTFQVGFCECYGSTETSSTCTYGRLGHGKAGSIGPAAEDWEVQVVDGGNREVACGDVGEIVVKGPGVFRGYWKMPAATREAFTDGWFHTGDLGRRDEDGYFYIVDRKKDMLICGGYNVYPREVEEVLYSHPAVLEAAVVGLPDPVKGEIPKAFISLRPGQQTTAEEIITYCRSKMAAYKVPRLVELLPELPKNMSGKILKRSLKATSQSDAETG
ncbi:AMP-dependent synthetase/ligase [Acididesulfobacillus acetoxydans]|uniref:AMP-dependent synthetase/ligase n=1 Tax=Acididesulfobacillus acetoxydans TaxID=1561005 RepID=A0A8S0XBE5_9FIRM|nr:long-chain-fatty-acid--CoA ligase [Acididesulfobacillus acetoxydans]CAA7601136.1 AMP-dependent synthetase/ligase [Acididesulfobacillus acetoxydans]CEJ08585.1 Long-chain-fatty-acid--CoA ligase [Acididesulfobacillus acetoxydans]